MHRNRLVTGLAGAFGVMTAILGGAGIATLNPALLLPAVLFGAVTYFLYYQASGRLVDRLYRGVERQASTDGLGERSDPARGGFGAGPREEWTPPRDGTRRRVSERVRQERRRREARAGRRRRDSAGAERTGHSGPTAREASRVLGVDPDADDGTIRRAYRERIKEVHPDADGGDEDEFKRVQEAYETLTD